MCGEGGSHVEEEAKWSDFVAITSVSRLFCCLFSMRICGLLERVRVQYSTVGWKREFFEEGLWTDLSYRIELRRNILALRDGRNSAGKHVRSPKLASSTFYCDRKWSERV